MGAGVLSTARQPFPRIGVFSSAAARRLPLPSPGALLCVHQAGAYASAMASNYSSRPRAAEVLVPGGRAALVRRRERYSDLVRNERP